MSQATPAQSEAQIQADNQHPLINIEKRRLMAALINLEPTTESGRGSPDRYAGLINDAADIVERIFAQYPDRTGWER